MLASVPLDGSTAPRIRWRAPMAAEMTSVSMDAKGTRLLLTFVVSAQRNKTSLRYVVLDAGQL